MRRIKILYLLLLVIISGELQAQLTVTPIVKKTTRADQAFAKKSDHTLVPPIFDDFSRNSELDESIWETGSGVDVSASIGLNVPTINVAIFNGIDATGAPYDLLNQNGENSVSSDSLVSHPIDMTQVPLGLEQSTYLRFFWQAKGLGEMPDATDSLSLYFLDRDSIWINQDISPDDMFVNGIVGGNGALRYLDGDTTQLIFTAVQVPISDPRYYHENFRIRFQNYGNPQGPFDTWLLDYVYLNFDESADNGFYKDRAMTMVPTSPFGIFNSIPYDHYDAFNQTSLTTEMESFNLESPDSIQPLSYFVNILDENGDFLYQVNDSIAVPNTSISQRNKFLSREFDLNDIFDFNDTVNFTIEAYLKTDDADLIPNSNVFSYLTNDTVKADFKIERHYAYDDGIPEFAAGISREDGKLVVAFPVLTRDTITHIDLNFPNIAPSPVGQNLNILLLKDLTGRPESVLINQPFLVSTATSATGFFRIPFTIPQIVEDTIYVGYQQSENRSLAVGLDKNNLGGTTMIYTQLDDDEPWERNVSVLGSLMIRPVFGRVPGLVTSSNPDTTIESINLFPNPVVDRFRISVPISSLAIYDLQGKKMSIQWKQGQDVDVSNLGSGIYLAVIAVQNEQITLKFVKK